ncbi:hypothetical protein HCAG_01941 [Histoplasma mississippiense (nom. inval.)]|uniref:hypothetical protein n=1 Tax=Ajellomyces capsulatus (strain NAm1 / WU24) TaxID=2059318 RepID=UPI000157BA61|nr:hypothetical protein HCAG_01941 [Histoplasma mississippiense (nom. inval.)]EDN04076.1 hypothetical protein HCAG_01941 [Histoplasma mississippiense (nom. inval.)]
MDGGSQFLGKNLNDEAVENVSFVSPTVSWSWELGFAGQPKFARSGRGFPLKAVHLHHRLLLCKDGPETHSVVKCRTANSEAAHTIFSGAPVAQYEMNFTKSDPNDWVWRSPPKLAIGLLENVMWAATTNEKFEAAARGYLYVFPLQPTTICEVTPGIRAYAGYVHLPAGTLEDVGVYQNYSINTFFWFFEAREDPINAPIAIFLNGGPGSSSM